MITAVCRGRVWRFADAEAKLTARSRLPGAYAFDRAAHALRLARLRELPAIELLPLALGTSWLVNNPVLSPVFRRWLTPPLAGAWATVLEGLTSAAWPAVPPAQRVAVATALAVIAVDGHGAGALSKVLALLVPEAVPLMPDAAIAFAIGAVEPPAANAPDAQTAPIGAFLPMMDWFHDALARSREALEAVADAHGAPLDEAQVLDRLVWFDSVGYRHFRAKSGAPAWVPTEDGDRSAIVAAAPASP